MASNFKIGATLAIDGEKEFKAALSEANKELKVVASEAKATAAAYKLNGDELKALTENQEQSNKKVEIQREKVNALKEALETLMNAEEQDTKKIQDYTIQLNNASAELDKYTKEAQDSTKAVNDYEKAHSGVKGVISEAKDAVDKFAEAHPKAAKAMETATEAAKKVASAVGTGLKAAAEVGAAAVGAVGAGIVKIGKDSVEAYAEQEQLIGGMKKLYGEDAPKMIEQANNAFKTAGMSASEYMETATQFSASLISTLDGDTKKAAEYSDKAIQQMADNANTFGTDITTIENAYKNFARDNYTMLDSLSLGYAGTKEGMVELINDSGVLGKKIENLDGIGLDTIIDAIGKVQDKMNITGATAEEANQTIEGSVNAAKSAYENLIAGLGNEDADVGQLVDNLIESGFIAFENIVDRVDEILPSLAGAVDRLGEKVPDLLSNVFEDIVPDLLDTATNLVESLGDCLIESIPVLVPAAADIVTGLVEFLSENVDDMIDAAAEIVTTLVDSLSDEKNSKKLVSGAIDMVGAIVKSLIENAPDLLDAALEMGAALVSGLINYDWKSLAKSIYASIKNSIIGFFSGGDDNESHAGGIGYVPYDYVAQLHKGEEVLTAAEASGRRDYSTLEAKVDMLIANQNQTPVNVNISGSAGAMIRALDIEVDRENKRKSAFA